MLKEKKSQKGRKMAKINSTFFIEWFGVGDGKQVKDIIDK